MTGHIGKNRRTTKKDKTGQKSVAENKENGSFPSLPQGTELTTQSTSDGSSEVEDKIPFEGSRFTLLPPIERRSDLTSTRPLSPTYIVPIQSSKSIIEIEKSHSSIGKPIGLPPIESSDGITNMVNTKLRDSMDKQRREQMDNIKPPKRSKTHTMHKDLQRGDSFELLRAEKIRCAELESYQANPGKRNAEWDSRQGSGCSKRDQGSKRSSRKRKDQDDRVKVVKKSGKKREVTTTKHGEDGTTSKAT